MSERYLGRFAVCDSDGGFGRRVGDNATMKHIGTLHGAHMSAERSDDGDLKLYSTTDDYGNPGTRTAAGDTAPLSLVELNQLYAKSHAVGIRPRR